MCNVMEGGWKGRNCESSVVHGGHKVISFMHFHRYHHLINHVKTVN